MKRNMRWENERKREKDRDKETKIEKIIGNFIVCKWNIYFVNIFSLVK